MSLADMYPAEPIYPLNMQWGDGPISARMHATAFAAFVEEYDNELRDALGPYYNQDIGIVRSIQELTHRMESLEK